MGVIAVSWGVLDAIVWPAVVNGVSILSQDEQGGQGLAMGLLGGIAPHRVLMNDTVIVILMVWSDHTVSIMHVPPSCTPCSSCP